MDMLMGRMGITTSKCLLYNVVGQGVQCHMEMEELEFPALLSTTDPILTQ